MCHHLSAFMKYRGYRTTGIVRLLPLEIYTCSALVGDDSSQRLSIPQMPDCRDLDLMIRLWSTTWFTPWLLTTERLSYGDLTTKAARCSTTRPSFSSSWTS